MEKKIFALLSDYMQAKNENNIQGMWDLIYDCRGTSECDFFDQMNRENSDFRKIGMQVIHKLVEVKNVREKGKEGFHPGGWVATVVYQKSGWQREKDVMVVEENGKLLLDYKDRI